MDVYCPAFLDLPTARPGQPTNGHEGSYGSSNIPINELKHITCKNFHLHQQWPETFYPPGRPKQCTNGYIPNQHINIQAKFINFRCALQITLSDRPL